MSLAPGDTIRLHDHRRHATWGDTGEREGAEGYLLGLLIGDGVLKEDKAILSVWPGRLAANGGYERPGSLAVMEHALSRLRSCCRIAPTSRLDGSAGSRRMAVGDRRSDAVSPRPWYGARAQGDHRRTSSGDRPDSTAGFLRGLFDADGSVQGAQAKGVSIRLSQSDLIPPRGRSAHARPPRHSSRHLSRTGVRPGETLLPDGRGGQKLLSDQGAT